MSHRIAEQTNSSFLLIGNDYRIQWISRPVRKSLFEGEGTVVGKLCAHVLKDRVCSARCLNAGEMISPAENGSPFGSLCLEERLDSCQVRNTILRDSKGTTVGLLKMVVPRETGILEESADNDTDLEASLFEAGGACETSFPSTLSRIARTTIPVLLVGETGTGKEVLAHRIHHLSPRKDRPFVVLDLSVVPETLVDDSLFGHARGSFTGATADYTGKLLQADKGTLFLDELENIPLPVQAKLLRFLETGIIEHIGKNQRTLVDVRILAATNVDPVRLLKEGRLREDLYYRLRGMTVDIPPLRARKEEIPLLIRSFRMAWGEKYGGPVPEFEDSAIDRFASYPYPGNIRELKHLVDLCLALSSDPTITESNLPEPVLKILSQSSSIPEEGEKTALPEPEFEPMRATLSSVERKMIQKALADNQGRITETAKTLSMSRITLWRKMQKYGLDKRHPFAQ